MIIKETKAPEMKEFRNPEPGLYLARLFAIVDLGTQTIVWEGQQKQLKKVIFNWELFGDDKNGPLEIDGKPLTVNKRYTLSLHEKSGLRADLEAWGGKKLDHEQLKGFDMSKLINKFAMVNVTHNEYQGKTYANISGLAQVPSMIKTFPQAANESFLYEISKHPANFDKVWPWQQKFVEQSAEFRNAPAVHSIEDDDVPF